MPREPRGIRNEATALSVLDQNYGLAALLILVQVFVWDIVFRDFVRPDFAFIGVWSVFHALHDFAFERVPFLEQFIHAL
jgi:hypothetical protein